MTRPLPRLIALDLDGTLIDSAPDLHRVVNLVLGEFDRDPLSLAEVRRMVGDGAARLVARALEARPGAAVAESAALRRFLDLYEAAPTQLTHLYPGVAETLAAFQDSGIALALCTNKPERSTRQILEALGIAACFGRVVAGDTLPWRKPDPRMLTHLLDATGVERTQALLVGDSEVDAETARSAGIAFVLMTYGYRRGPVETIPCLAALDRFELLPTLLERLRAAPNLDTADSTA